MIRDTKPKLEENEGKKFAIKSILLNWDIVNFVRLIHMLCMFFWVVCDKISCSILNPMFVLYKKKCFKTPDYSDGVKHVELILT